MHNPGLSALCLVGLSLTIASAQESQKPNLTGSWELSVANSEIHASNVTAATWFVEQRGLSIHITRVEKLQDSKETKREFRCTTDGKDCEADGMKISLWYDGAVLVEMDVGEIIYKYSMALAPGGKALTVEVVHIVPGGDKETLLFNKVGSL